MSIKKTITKIEALLRQADHPNTGPAEADAFRRKAEALMLKHRIDEMQLGQDDEGGASLAVAWRTFYVAHLSSEFRSDYATLFRTLCHHFEIMVEFEWDHDDDGKNIYMGNVCGYESDLAFFETLWQQIRLEFGKRLEPRVDPDLSFGENAYRLRKAGVEGQRMALMLCDGDDKKSNRIKARNAAKKYAESIREDPSAWSGQGNSMSIYRESYASGFRETISTRLYSMRRSRQIAEAGALVLASRKTAIEEEFYNRYPERKIRNEQLDAAAQSTVDEFKSCKKCSKAKSGYCREHSWMRPRYKRYKVNAQARESGRSAARNVNLGITSREVG